MKMEMTTLLEELRTIGSIVEKYALSEGPTNYLYWELFLRYIDDSTFVSNTIIEEFLNRCPSFSKKLSEFAVSKKRIIMLEYAQKKAPHQELVSKCEDGQFSHVLYAHMYDSSSMSSYRPFGKLIFPKEPEYFIEFISKSHSRVLTDDEEYELFKDYFYSHIVHEIKTEWSHHYAFEFNIWQNIKSLFPDLAIRFEKEQDDYLHKIGYYDSKNALARLNKEYDTLIASMSQEEKDKFAEIWPDGENYICLPRNNRRIEILY